MLRFWLAEETERKLLISKIFFLKKKAFSSAGLEAIG